MTINKKYFIYGDIALELNPVNTRIWAGIILGRGMLSSDILGCVSKIQTFEEMTQDLVENGKSHILEWEIHSVYCKMC